MCRNRTVCLTVVLLFSAFREVLNTVEVQSGASIAATFGFVGAFKGLHSTAARRQCELQAKRVCCLASPRGTAAFPASIETLSPLRFLGLRSQHGKDAHPHGVRDLTSCEAGPDPSAGFSSSQFLDDLRQLPPQPRRWDVKKQQNRWGRVAKVREDSLNSTRSAATNTEVQRRIKECASVEELVLLVEAVFPHAELRARSPSLYASVLGSLPPATDQQGRSGHTDASGGGGRRTQRGISGGGGGGGPFLTWRDAAFAMSRLKHLQSSRSEEPPAVVLLSEEPPSMAPRSEEPQSPSLHSEEASSARCLRALALVVSSGLDALTAGGSARRKAGAEGGRSRAGGDGGEGEGEERGDRVRVMDKKLVCMALNSLTDSVRAGGGGAPWLFDSAAAFLMGQQRALSLDAASIAICLNAYVREGEVREELFEYLARLAASRPAYQFRPQTVAMILNALGNAEVPPPPPLLPHVATVLRRLRPERLPLPELAGLLDAYYRVERLAGKREEAVVCVLVESLRLRPNPPLGPHQHHLLRPLCVLLNALAALQVCERDLFLRLSAPILDLPPSAISPQAAAVLVAAHSKAGVRSTPLFRLLSAAALGLPARLFTPKDAAAILKGYSRLSLSDPALFDHMGDALLSAPLSAHSLASAASSLHAIAFAPHVQMTRHADIVALLYSLLLALPPSSFELRAVLSLLSSLSRLPEPPPPAALTRRLLDSLAEALGGGADLSPPTIATTFHALARLRVGEEEAVQRLAEAALAVEAARWDAVAVAQTSHSLVKLGLHRPALLAHLSLATLLLPPHTLTAQAAALILYSFTAFKARDSLLYVLLFSRLRKLAPTKLSVRTVTMVVKALVRAEKFDLPAKMLRREALGHVAGALKQLPPSSFSPLDCAALITAVVQWEGRYAGVLEHMALVVQGQDAKALGARGGRGFHQLPILLHAFSSVGWEEPGLYVALGKGLEKVEAGGLTQAETVSVAASLARANCRYHPALRRLRELVLEAWDPAHAANGTAGQVTALLDSFLKLNATDASLFHRLANYTLAMRAEEHGLDDMAYLASAFAKWVSVGAEQREGVRAEHSANSTHALFKHFSHLMRELLKHSSVWPHIQLFHHHGDGVVHQHAGGHHLHYHRADGSVVASGEVAPMGGSFVQYARPGGVVVSAGQERAPPSAICPLLWVQAEANTVKAIALLANAFAKAAVRDKPLFAVLSSVLLQMSPQAFSPWTLSFLLTAIATLRLPLKPLARRLAEIAMQTPPQRFSPREVGSLAWAAGVEGMEGVGGWRRYRWWLWWRVAGSFAAFEPLHRRQVHHFALQFRPLLAAEGLMDPPRQRLALACSQEFQARSADHASPSALQEAVAETLRRMGLELLTDWVEPETGYSLDIKLLHSNTVVEVDGPSHFVLSARAPLGPTAAKRRHIAAAGYALVVVPYWEWDALPLRAAQLPEHRAPALLRAREQYMLQKLAEVGEEEVPGARVRREERGAAR